MNNNPWIQRLLHDTQAMLTLSYGVLILLGGVFDYLYYQKFGIDILNYSSIFDLLVEPFRKPTILLFFSGTVFFLWLIYLFDQWWQRKYPNSYSKLRFGTDKKAWYPAYRFVIFFAVFLYYIFIAASVNAAYQENVWRKGAQSIRFCFNSSDCFHGKLIGTNSNFCFVQVEDKIQIIPINSQLAFWESAYSRADSTLTIKP